MTFPLLGFIRVVHCIIIILGVVCVLMMKWNSNATSLLLFSGIIISFTFYYHGENTIKALDWILLSEATMKARNQIVAASLEIDDVEESIGRFEGNDRNWLGEEKVLGQLSVNIDMLFERLDSITGDENIKAQRKSLVQRVNSVAMRLEALVKGK